MDTLLVRLQPFDPRRGHVLRRYVYKGARFQVERGWYRVSKEVAEHLRSVRQAESDPHSPAAFDICTEEEAQRKDADTEARERAVRATDSIPVTPARGEAQAVRAQAAGGESHVLTGGEAGARRARKE